MSPSDIRKCYSLYRGVAKARMFDPHAIPWEDGMMQGGPLIRSNSTELSDRFKLRLQWIGVERTINPGVGHLRLCRILEWNLIVGKYPRNRIRLFYWELDSSHSYPYESQQS